MVFEEEINGQSKSDRKNKEIRYKKNTFYSFIGNKLLCHELI